MGRKTQITKEQMLQAAYEILMEEGYSSVNIKTIAAKVGCSTQPISWQFGNMQGLRRELYLYASAQIYAGAEEKLKDKTAFQAFFETGKIYISNALENPNVFRFLCVDDPGDIVDGKKDVTEFFGDDFIKEMLHKELGLSEEIIGKLVADVVIYTHGLATVLLWDSFKLDKKTAYQMILDQGIRCFAEYGVDLSEFI